MKLPFPKEPLLISILSATFLAGCGSGGQQSNDSDQSNLQSWAKRAGDTVRDWGTSISAYISSSMELATLRSRVDTAKADNLLSPSQLRSLDNSLKFIGNEIDRIDNLSGSKLTAHREKLNQDLNRVSNRLDVWTSIAKLDFETKLANLRQKITVAKSENDLSKEQKDSLDNSLRWINNLRLRSTNDGNLSQAERTDLLLAIDRVDRRLDGWVASKSDARWF